MSITLTDLKKELKPWILSIIQTGGGAGPYLAGAGTANKVAYYTGTLTLSAASHLTVGTGALTIQPSANNTSTFAVNDQSTVNLFKIDTTNHQTSVTGTSTTITPFKVTGAIPNNADWRASSSGFDPTQTIYNSQSNYPEAIGFYTATGSGNGHIFGQYETTNRGGLGLQYRNADSNLATFLWGSGRYNIVLFPVGNIGIGYAATSTSLSYKLDVSGTIGGTNYTSTVATGTSPYACTSTTLNTNLNADLLDGYHAAQFLGGTVYWVTKSANYTLTSTDYHVTVTAAATMTLPTAASIAGKTYTITHDIAAGGTVTVQCAGAELLDGYNTWYITSRYDSMSLRSNGTGWEIV